MSAASRSRSTSRVLTQVVRLGAGRRQIDDLVPAGVTCSRGVRECEGRPLRGAHPSDPHSRREPCLRRPADENDSRNHGRRSIRHEIGYHLGECRAGPTTPSTAQRRRVAAGAHAGRSSSSSTSSGVPLRTGDQRRRPPAGGTAGHRERLPGAREFLAPCARQRVDVGDGSRPEPAWARSPPPSPRLRQPPHGGAVQGRPLERASRARPGVRARDGAARGRPPARLLRLSPRDPGSDDPPCAGGRRASGNGRATLGRQLPDHDLRRGDERDGDEGADDSEERRAEDHAGDHEEARDVGRASWIVAVARGFLELLYPMQTASMISASRNAPRRATSERNDCRDRRADLRDQAEEAGDIPSASANGTPRPRPCPGPCHDEGDHDGLDGVPPDRPRDPLLQHHHPRRLPEQDGGLVHGDRDRFGSSMTRNSVMNAIESAPRPKPKILPPTSKASPS